MNPRLGELVRVYIVRAKNSICTSSLQSSLLTSLSGSYHYGLGVSEACCNRASADFARMSLLNLLLSSGFLHICRRPPITVFAHEKERLPSLITVVRCLDYPLRRLRYVPASVVNIRRLLFNFRLLTFNFARLVVVPIVHLGTKGFAGS